MVTLRPRKKKEATKIYINNLETVPLCVTLQTKLQKLTISKDGLDVLYRTRMKMGIIKSVLIKLFYLKKYTFFLYQLCILKICLVSFDPFQTDFDTFPEQFYTGNIN